MIWFMRGRTWPAQRVAGGATLSGPLPAKINSEMQFSARAVTAIPHVVSSGWVSLGQRRCVRRHGQRVPRITARFRGELPQSSSTLQYHWQHSLRSVFRAHAVGQSPEVDKCREHQPGKRRVTPNSSTIADNTGCRCDCDSPAQHRSQ